MTAQYTSHVPRKQNAMFLCTLKMPNRLDLPVRSQPSQEAPSEDEDEDEDDGESHAEPTFGHLKSGQFVSPWDSLPCENQLISERDLIHSGSVRRSKRTRKLCSGTLYRKPSSAPPMCGIALLPLSTNSSPSTHRGFLNPGCAILP